MLGVLACGPSFQVPREILGDVPITISNRTQSSLCEFDMGLEHQRGGANWIGRIKPASGARLAFNVKPGTYWLVVKGCTGDFVAGSTHVVVNGRTDVVLTPMNWAGVDLPPVAGYAHVEVPVMMTASFVREHRPAPAITGGGGSRGGEPAGEAEGAPECGYLGAYCGGSWPACCAGTACKRTDRTGPTGDPIFECG